MPNCADICIYILLSFPISRLPSQGAVIANHCLQAPFDYCIMFSTEIMTLKCYLLSTLHTHLLGTWNNPPLATILA